MKRAPTVTPTKAAKKPRAAATPGKGKKAPMSCGALLAEGAPLIELGSSDDETRALVEAEVVRRPSARNRSPYVADVKLADGREAICHVPSLDLGGKCAAGATVLVKPALDKKGNPVGSEAVSPKYGTPKCEFICQLAKLPSGSWVGAHPALGERITEALLARTAVLGDVWAGDRETAALAREVTAPFGQDMRVDCVVSGPGCPDTVLEVKTVVDADADAGFGGAAPGGGAAAIFPWGRSGQKGPDGEKVVSARAIKHVDCLAHIAEHEAANAAVLFVCVRDDVVRFRPNVATCPSFAAHLAAASDAGVNLVARRVRWVVGEGTAHAVDDGAIPVELVRD